MFEVINLTSFFVGHSLGMVKPVLIIIIFVLLSVGVTPFIGNITKRPELTSLFFLLKISLLYTVSKAAINQRFEAFRIGVYTPSKLEFTHTTQIGLLFDQTSAPFFFTTLFIGLMSIFFTHYYMWGEVHASRFSRLLLLFLFSMLLLLTSDNLITLFLGWELIGLYSFLLINFWVTKTTALKSAFKALLYNQLSDAALLGFIVVTFLQTKQCAITSNDLNLHDTNSHLAAMCLIVCAGCKSAQAPFHYWLPDSMEAPIPASALIHSATLVSAGVFLVIRLWEVHQLPPLFSQLLVYMSVITIVCGGVGAAAQSDLKKTLAYSTISNCGFMMLFGVLNSKSLCFFYFLFHGIFKALSFLLVGAIVLIMGHKQDWRYNNLNSCSRHSLLAGLSITILLLGAWPLFTNNFIKHINLSSLTTPSTLVYTQAFVFAGTLLGSLMSLVYSAQILTNLYSTTNIKAQPTGLQSQGGLQIPKQLISYVVGAASAVTLYNIYTTLVVPTEGLVDSTFNSYITTSAPATQPMWDIPLLVVAAFLLLQRFWSVSSGTNFLVLAWVLVGCVAA